MISNASMRQRKYSTDRVLRQAELSARLEEGRPIVTPAAQIDEHPNENDPEQLNHQGIRSLTRADSMISPFEFHPGQRIESFPFTPASGFNTQFSFGAIKAWDEPTEAQQADIERRAAVPQRVDTTSLDFSPAQAQIYRNITQSVSQKSLLRWPFWKTKITEPSALNGLRIATAMHAAIGLRFVAQKSPDWLRRQQLHVFEYTTRK